MVSLDDAVLARMEKGGKRYEILVDPDLVDQFKTDPSSVKIDDFFAMDEVFHDARGGERPTEDAIENTFCLLYTSPSPRDLSTSRMPSSA